MRTVSTQANDERGEFTFADQSQRPEGTVLVSDVRIAQDATIIVTYDHEGVTIVAGITAISPVDGEDIEIDLVDTSAIPGTHEAHLVPTSELSTPDYAPGDPLSATTTRAALDTETATIDEPTFEPAVRFPNQTATPAGEVTLVEVRAPPDHTLVVTSDRNGSQIVEAAVAFGDGDGGEFTLDLYDPESLPGVYTGHLLPDDSTSQGYELGDALSEETIDVVVASDTAVVDEFEELDELDESDDADDSDGFAPGFGIAGGLTGLGGLVYLLQRRKGNPEQNEL